MARPRRIRRTPGLSLKLERVAADIMVKDLAEAMGINNSRLSRIEDEPAVTLEMEERYRAALAKCRTSRTSDPAAIA